MARGSTQSRNNSLVLLNMRTNGKRSKPLGKRPEWRESDKEAMLIHA
jgi:hypothetical protein